MPASRFAVLVTAASAVVLAACGAAPSTGGPDGSTEVASVEGGLTVAELEELRTTVAPAAVAVGTGAAEVGRAAAGVRDDVGTVDGLEDAAQGLRTALEDLGEVRDDELPAPLADGLDRVLDVGGRLADAADAAATGTRRRTEVRGELVAAIATWDEEGSRSQQLERFAMTEAALRELADTPVAAPDTCDDAVLGLRGVAGEAADVTAELVEAVRGYDGARFDELRRENGARLLGQVPEAPSAADCPALGTVDEAGEEVVAALESVESALNPEELVTPG